MKKKENLFSTQQRQRELVGLFHVKKRKKHVKRQTTATWFSFSLQYSPASESFPMSQLFTSGGESIRTSASATTLSNEYSGLILMALIGNGNNDMASWGRQMRQFVAEGEELRDSACHTLNPNYRCPLYMSLYMFIFIYMYTHKCIYMDMHILCMYVLYYDSFIYSSVAEHKFELFPIWIVMHC